MAAKTRGWTLKDWREAYLGGQSAEGLLSALLAELSSEDPAWIRLVTVEELRAQWSALEALGSPASLPFYGVPYAVKDNIDVAGLPTTAACPAFSYVPERDAAVVESLRRAGAIVLGKTNLDQFATGLVGTRSPYGVVPSTFDDRYIGGGSSSGSASVVSRGLVPFALGTDTAGSGRVPAAFQNIVGIKPTLGRLSTRGVVPACRSLDCVSVFSLTVDDGAELARLVAGYDPLCAESRRQPPSAPGSASSRRLAVPERPDFAGDPEAEQAFAASRRALESAGFSLVPIDFSPFQSLARLLYEGPWVAERLLAVEGLLARDPEALHPVVRAIVEKGNRFSARDAFHYGYERSELKRAMEEALAPFAALLVPTTPTTFSIEETLADPIAKNSTLGTYTNFTNLGDLSAVAVPGHFRQGGLPAGLTLLAPAWQDEALAELGREVQALLALPLGATGRPWSAELAASAGAAPGTRASATSSAPAATTRASAESGPVGSTLIAVLGAHLSGMALNHQLTSRGATLAEKTRTAPRYRLFVMANTTPQKPAILRVPAGERIELEVWSMPNESVAAFLGDVSSPLAIGSLELESGAWVKGFVAEPCAFDDAQDITVYGGFRAWSQARQG